MLDRMKYIAIAVDIDGEVNLVGEKGEIVVLFPRGTVEGMTEIKDARSNLPMSWLFYFSPNPGERPFSRDVVLDYLDGKE